MGNTCRRPSNSLLKYCCGCSPKWLLVWKNCKKAIGKHAKHEGASLGIWITAESWSCSTFSVSLPPTMVQYWMNCQPLHGIFLRMGLWSPKALLVWKSYEKAMGRPQTTFEREILPIWRSYRHGKAMGKLWKFQKYHTFTQGFPFIDETMLWETQADFFFAMRNRCRDHSRHGSLGTTIR